MAEGQIIFHVARPPAQVWSALADIESAPEWVPNLLSVTKLGTGEIGVGARYRQVVELAGNRVDVELEVTDFEPPQLFAQSGQGGPAQFSARFELESDGEGTRVTHDYSVELSGPMRFMEPMIRMWMQSSATEAVESLARRVESLAD